MSRVAIEMSAVSCVFGSQRVLWNLNLSLNAGETVAIVGESGCGKSVTMKVMMQLLQQTSGRLSWFGRDIAAMSAAQRREQRLRLGYLFQGAALFDSLTVYENVAFGLRQANETDEREILNTVLARLDEVGLSDDIIQKRPTEISGGMQKRVGLARALALSPEVMFYDEPTTGLDPVNCRRIDKLIDSVRRARGVTGVIVTHDLRTVQRVADRIVMLYPRSKLSDTESQVIFDGTLQQLKESTDCRVLEYVGDEFSDVRMPLKSTADSVATSAA